MKQIDDYMDDPKGLIEFLEKTDEDVDILVNEEEYAIVSKSKNFVVKIFEHYMTGREVCIYSYSEFISELKECAKEEDELAKQRVQNENNKTDS